MLASSSLRAGGMAQRLATLVRPVGVVVLVIRRQGRVVHLHGTHTPEKFWGGLSLMSSCEDGNGTAT